MTTTLVPVAQYLRMSTDYQQYLLVNQAAAIARYATEHGFSVVKTYTDAAKSGLRLKNRLGLQRLLRDVVEGETGFRNVLVYDVSRWGRFQDMDVQPSMSDRRIDQPLQIPVEVLLQNRCEVGSVDERLF